MSIAAQDSVLAEHGWQHPSPRLLAARRLLLSLVAVPLLVAGGITAGLTGGVVPAVATAAVIVGVTGAAHAVIARRFRAWGWAERDDDLLVRRGVLLRRLSVVPYGRMQFVDVTAGPIDRLFKLSTVQLHTAAASTDARIPGLPVAEATRLRDTLAALGEARASGI